MNLKKLIALRKKLHQFPEVSENEKETSKTLYQFIKAYHPQEVIYPIGGYGILATWDSGKEGPEVLFRGDMDALPIQEVSTFEYQSKNQGVAHMCGHDGHSAILCGLAMQLNHQPPQSGKVHLLFQPAEENGMGAKAILNDPKFERINPDFVFALHNLPGYPLHQIVLKEGAFTCAVNSIVIRLKGKTSHAAEPEHGINPAIAMTEIMQQVLKKNNNDIEQDDMRVITPIFVKLGAKDYGISAGEASIHFTLRCLNNVQLEALENEIMELSKKIAHEHQLEVDIAFTQSFSANMNNSEAVEMVRKAAHKNKLSISERNYPFKWGEDFGLFTTKFKGCMFGIGSGENCPALHNPDYDFPDEIIETAVHVFVGIIGEITEN
jgi:amidohydrolase